MQRTLIILKPDAVQRQLMGQIITRFEQRGLQMIACKFMRITPDLAAKHYAEHVEKPFYPGLVKYMTSDPVLVMVWQGDDVIAAARKMMGATFANNAEPGTIRGDLGSAPNTYNLIHGSDSAESAAREIKLFFGEDEICDYDMATADWIRPK
ncbi:MAG: nucleoside-diphosphate kinase [Sedimentisphaerales bacterium]|nr:nucleoside-diphosphate kinase [Sedimentisphaerales bacterium]